MPATTCDNCGGHAFELAAVTPLASQARVSLIQCSGCGTPFGVVDEGTPNALEALAGKVSSIDARLAAIARALSG